MKFFKYAVLILSTVLLTGCSSLSGLIDKPQLSVADFKLTQANLLQQSFKIRMKVDNPNSFSIPVLGLNYGLSIAGVDITQGTTNQGVRIPANGTDYLEIDFSTNLLKTLPDLKDVILSGGKSLSYNLTGDVNLDNPIISKLPFSKTGQFDLRF